MKFESAMKRFKMMELQESEKNIAENWKFLPLKFRFALSILSHPGTKIRIRNALKELKT